MDDENVEFIRLLLLPITALACK